MNKWINFQISESALTDKLIALSPWLTPLSAMQITITNMIDPLGYWPPIAILTGAAIEILLVAIFKTGLDFYQHNKRYKDEKNKMPLWIPILAFAFYILLIIGVVFTLEIPLDEKSKPWVYAGIKASLVLLSIPAGVIISVRKMHQDTLEKLSRKGIKPEKDSESKAQVSESRVKVSESEKQTPETFARWPDVPDPIRREVAKLATWEQVQEKFPYLKDKTAQNWLRYAHKLYP